MEDFTINLATVDPREGLKQVNQAIDEKEQLLQRIERDCFIIENNLRQLNRHLKEGRISEEEAATIKAESQQHLEWGKKEIRRLTNELVTLRGAKKILKERCRQNE